MDDLRTLLSKNARTEAQNGNVMKDSADGKERQIENHLTTNGHGAAHMDKDPSTRKRKDVDLLSIQKSVHQILVAVGEDPTREGLQDTPRRVAQMFSELLSGYALDPSTLVNNALFSVPHNDMVVIHDIGFHSLCEHHILTFSGRVHVAYIPNKAVIGLSKVPRVVEMFARRLQVQERLNSQVAEFLWRTLEPKGLGVIVDGSHLCATIRGVKSHGAKMTTSVMLGEFKESAALRAEMWSQIREKRS